jgi:hypothetical protein
VTIKVLVLGESAGRELRSLENALEPNGFTVVRGKLDERDDERVLLVDAMTALMSKDVLHAVRQEGAAIVGYGPNRENGLEIDGWLAAPFDAANALETIRTAVNVARGRASASGAPPALDGPAEGDMSPASGLAMIAELSRDRASGELVVTTGDTRYGITLVKGLVTGAVDNGTKYRLLGRMVKAGVIKEEMVGEALDYAKQNGMRAAEALLALGACTGRQLVDALRSQCLARVTAGIAAEEGTYVFTPDPEAKGGTSLIDVHEIAANVADASIGKEHLKRWWTDNQERSFTAGVGATATATARGWLPLPGFEDALKAKSKYADVVAQVKAATGPASGIRSAARLWAMQAIGTAVFEGESPAGEMPAVPKSTGAAAAAAEAVFDEWVKAEGRDLFAFLDISREAGVPEIQAAYDAKKQRIGREAFADIALGDASSAASSLWGLLEDVEDWLLDDTRREIYREELNRMEPVGGHDQNLDDGIDIDVAFPDLENMLDDALAKG